jgi:nucleoside-diphosphate kinase
LRAFVLLKPETIQRNIAGRIISDLEDKGLKIIAIKMLMATREQIEQLYSQWRDLQYFDQMVAHSIDGPAIAIALEAPSGLEASSLLGTLQGSWQAPGTIRHRYVAHQSRNVIHCSDNPDASAREIPIFFDENELCRYDKDLDRWFTDGS